MGKPRGQKKKKVELVFDPKKRREYLTGFSKRKQERRKIAKEELEKSVKEERKRIKQEIKDGFQSQFKQSFAPIELHGQMKEEEYETEDVTVQIVELSTDDLAKSNNWIGANKPIYANGNKPDTNEKEDEEDEEEEDEEEVPGFTVTRKKMKVPKKLPAPSTEVVNPDLEEDAMKKEHSIKDDFKSKRAVGQFLAKKAQSSLRQSKAFQTKNKLDKVRSKKKARIEKDKRIKLQNKREKFKKGPTKAPKVSKFSRKKKAPKKKTT